jgi:hypothetical protein
MYSIAFKLSHKMYFCTTYNNFFVNAVIKSIVLFQKVKFCDFLKALAQNTKTTFFKYRFLMIKHRLNTVKHSLLVEKDRGNACFFFLANFFRGLSFYGADCMCILLEFYCRGLR